MRASAGIIAACPLRRKRPRATTKLMTNRLYYGDNLDVLREQIASESVDLVYLDPPFNSNANYNLLFKSPAGLSADSQIEAIGHIWHLSDMAEQAFHDVTTWGNTNVTELLRAMRGLLKEGDMMAFPRLQIFTLTEYFRGLRPKVPLLGRQAAYKKAARAEDEGKQGSLL